MCLTGQLAFVDSHNQEYACYWGSLGLVVAFELTYVCTLLGHFFREIILPPQFYTPYLHQV
jgi:hypothetical protein